MRPQIYMYAIYLSIYIYIYIYITAYGTVLYASLIGVTHLGLAAKRRGADDRAGGEVERGVAVGRDPRVARVLTLEVARQNRAWHQPGGGIGQH